MAKAYVKSRRPKPKPEEFQATIENTLLVNHVPRSRSWFFTFNGRPSEADIDELIAQMKTYALQEGAFEILGFLREKDIPDKTWDTILETFPRVKDAYASMKKYLGYNQRQAVRYGTIDARFSTMSMHKYDPEWDEINKYHAKLKEQQNQDSGTKFIVIKEVEVSGLVKPLPKTGEQDGTAQVDTRRISVEGREQDPEKDRDIQPAP